MPVSNRFLEVSVGRGDHSYIHANGPVASHRFKLAFLQDPQQLHLRFEGQLADFIQKDRAAVSEFKPAHVTFKSAGKGSFDMPK